jgi:hypothetical protein
MTLLSDSRARRRRTHPPPRYITNKDYLEAAASILAVENEHDAWVGSAVEQGAAWSTAYQTPLGFSGVYSLACQSLPVVDDPIRALTMPAAQFITSCPSSNPALPVKALPGLTFSPPAPAPGSKVAITSDAAKQGAFIAWFSGLQVLFSPVTGNSTTVPAALAHAGTVYAALVTSDSAAPKDDQLMSGLAVIPFTYKSGDQQ